MNLKNIMVLMVISLIFSSCAMTPTETDESPSIAPASLDRYGTSMIAGDINVLFRQVSTLALSAEGTPLDHMDRELDPNVHYTDMSRIIDGNTVLARVCSRGELNCGPEDDAGHCCWKLVGQRYQCFHSYCPWHP